ncbi:RNA polymerase sigma factor, partial [Parasynechococcus sp.]|uniref:RNA polymerase sigma factor n=1 Tax=Parasynechococcus sp. TaxID=3101203 RepID=UPI0037048898
AMRMMRSSGGTALSSADALVVDHYRSKQHWVEFNDDLLNETPEGMELVERSDAWSRVKRLFCKLDKDDQCALQMVVINGMSLRQTAQQLGISAMTVQRCVKRGLNSLAKELNAAQLDA